MTTSGTSTGLMTAQELIQAALEELGVLSAGEIAEGSELNVGLRSLNWMLKSFAARGVNLWRQDQRTIIVPANTASITFDGDNADVEDVLDARLQQSATFDRQLVRYNREQYFQLPNKASRGYPTAYYVDRQRDAAVLDLWPVPVNQVTLNLDVLRIIQDVTDPTQTVDVPQRWTETIYIALAARMATVMGVTRIDPATANALALRAQTFEQILLDGDRPESIYMGAYGERYF